MDDNKDMCYKKVVEGEKTKYECNICGTLLSTKQRIFTHLINKHNKSPMKRVYKVYEDDPSLPIPKRTVLRHQSRRNILHNEELLTLSSSDEDMFVNSQENEGIVHVPYSEQEAQ